MARRLNRAFALVAVIVAAAVDAILLWMIEQLPLWVQIIVLGAPALLVVVGLVIAVRANRRRQRPLDWFRSYRDRDTADDRDRRDHDRHR